MLRTLARSLPQGAQLPSTRAVAAEQGVGPVTVQRAVRLLVAEGLVEPRPGVGNFVRERRIAPSRADYSWQTTSLGAAWPLREGMWGSGNRPVAPETIPLHSTYPAASLLPTDLVRRAFARAAKTEAVVNPAPAPGVPELRRWFAEALTRSTIDAPLAASSDVVVVSGGQAGITAAFAALTRPGDAVVMESPTYWGGTVAALAHGLRIVPIARTADGIDPDDLDTALATSGARVFYAQPTFANPTGQSWTPAVRERVLEVVDAHKAFVIEDDWARDFSIDDAPPPPLATQDPHGHVVYLRSVTKSLAPSVRVGALIARGPARTRLSGSRMAGELYTSGLLQAVALDVLRDPGWERHQRTLPARLRERRDALTSALTAVGLAGFEPPSGGLALWLRLADTTNATAVVGRCLQAGLALSAGPEWFPTEPDGQYLRLSFANADPHRFDEAARILAGILAD